jgi:hypothetical protein
MRRYALRLTLMLLALSFAGCSSTNSDDGVSVSPTPTPPMPPGNPPNRVEGLTAWANSDCEVVGTVFAWPFELGPRPEVPPGWEPVRRGALATVSFEVLECARISLGLLERGPLFIAFEAHRQFNSPESCQYGEWDEMEFVTRVYSDDEAVVNIFRAAGAAAEVATFSRTDEAVAEAALIRLEWTPFNHMANWLEAVDSSARDVNSGYSLRRFWSDGTNLTVLDSHQQFLVSNGGAPFMHGEMNPPMIYAEHQGTSYAGPGAIYREFSASGTMTTFEGVSCG